MRSLFLIPLSLVVGLVLTSLFPAFGADDKKKDKDNNDNKVKFETVDQVELHGFWYESDLGKKAPTVLLLHKLGAGNSSTNDGWGNLAKDLQKAHYAVLSFDFRGHGDSTSVAPAFWQDTSTIPLAGLTRINSQSVLGGVNPNKLKETIAIKDFNKGYYPVLVNDIAAAKSFLDRKNDNGECNSSNLILIGAEDGATLGAMWLYSELNRYRVTSSDLLGRPVKLASTPEGRDVSAVIWLSVSPSLGTRQVPAKEWITFAGKEKKVPMAFVYGEKDNAATMFSKRCFDSVKPPKDAKTKLTGEKPIQDCKLAGSALLSDQLPARKWMIDTYLKAVKEEQVRPAWEEKESEKAQFAWMIPGRRVPIVAKGMNEKTLGPIPFDSLLGR